MDIMSYLMGQNSAIKKGMKVEVVTELPETGEPNVIYLVPKQTAGQDDVFDEYIWINDDWELIGSTAIDISGKQDVMQFSTMPTADSTTIGKIVQYTGTTTNDYTNGYFYIGATDGTNYGWDRIDVQPGVEASNIAVCTIIGKNIGAIQVQPQNNGVVYLSGGAQTELTTFLNNHLGKYIILQLIGNNDANCIIYLGYLQTTTGNNIQTFPKYIFFYGSGSYNGSVFYGTTKVMYSYNATTNKYSIGFYENPFDGKPQPIATKKYVDDNKGQTIQYETMPTASADYVGKIVQYTGTTDSTYTNGYFYVGTTDGTNYSWSNINVQAGGSNLPIYVLNTTNQLNDDNSTQMLENDAKTQMGTILTDAYAKGYKNIAILLCSTTSARTYMFYSNSILDNSNGYRFFYTDVTFKNRSDRTKMFWRYFNVDGTWSSNVFTATSIGYSMIDIQYLAKDNYQPYTVTGEYNPAHKLYVDTKVLTTAGLSVYSTSTTYQAGDYVYKSKTDLTIYKCNTADTTGTWDSSKWTQATYMEYLSDTLVGGALNGSY